MTQTYRVGIIGCGGMWKSHASAYTQNPAIKLVAAMDIRPESAKKLAEEFSIPAVYS
mgnify:CR=1 FL=1